MCSRSAHLLKPHRTSPLLTRLAPPRPPRPSPPHQPFPLLLQALQKCQLLELMALSAVGLARRAALSPAFVRYRPSVVAAACLVRARDSLGLAPGWPRALQSMTAYLPTPESQLRQCLEVMALLGMTAA